MQITVNELSRNQIIVISTAWSVYRFWVTDPGTCLGVLTGGALGTRGRYAYFAGSRYSNALHVNGSKNLETGTHACFWMEGKSGANQLVTSLVVKLSCHQSFPTPAPPYC